MDSKDPILEDWKTCERFEWSDTCEWLRDLCALTLVLPSGLKPNLIFTGFRKVSKLSNFFSYLSMGISVLLDLKVPWRVLQIGAHPATGYGLPLPGARIFWPGAHCWVYYSLGRGNLHAQLGGAVIPGGDNWGTRSKDVCDYCLLLVLSRSVRLACPLKDPTS